MESLKAVLVVFIISAFVTFQQAAGQDNSTTTTIGATVDDNSTTAAVTAGSNMTEISPITIEDRNSTTSGLATAETTTGNTTAEGTTVSTSIEPLTVNTTYETTMPGIETTSSQEPNSTTSTYEPDSTTTSAMATEEANTTATPQIVCPPQSGFDGASFIGGIILALGVVAIIVISVKCYNYHTHKGEQPYAQF